MKSPIFYKTFPHKFEHKVHCLTLDLDIVLIQLLAQEFQVRVVVQAQVAEVSRAV